MHRSSTSLLARSLHGECYLGSEKHFIPPAPDNPKGFYEDRRIVLLNDFILNSFNSPWDNPKEIDINLVRNSKLENGLTIEEYAENILKDLYRESNTKTLCIKDPRMCLLIDFWWPLLKKPQVVCSFRNENDIAKSLQKRNGISLERGKDLTKYYNKKIKEFLNKIY